MDGQCYPAILGECESEPPIVFTIESEPPTRCWWCCEAVTQDQWEQ